MNAFYTVVTVFFSLLCFFFIMGYLCFLHTFRKNIYRDPAPGGVLNVKKFASYKKEIKEAILEYEGLEKETVCITSHDSLRLFASYIRSSRASNKLMIFFHGYRSCAASEFSCVSKKFLDAGFDILAVDQRAHGRSEGKYVGLGMLERYDCKSWCDYALERFGDDVEIYLYGISMGASTVLMASGLELPSCVRSIIADCGFDSPWDIIKYRMGYKYKLPIYPLMFFVGFWARIIISCDLKNVSASDAVKLNARPILFIHGDADDVVPLSHAKRTFESAQKTNADCKFLTFKNAKHVRSYRSDPIRYINELFNFLEKKNS